MQLNPRQINVCFVSDSGNADPYVDPFVDEIENMCSAYQRWDFIIDARIMPVSSHVVWNGGSCALLKQDNLADISISPPAFHIVCIYRSCFFF